MSRFESLLQEMLQKLARLYPEKKVFALSSLDDKLRETLNELYVEAGTESLPAFLARYGYSIITAEEAAALRCEVLYTPGNEPEPIRSKMQNLIALLEQYYPDRVIGPGLQSEHKSVSQKISGLYLWLGYADAAAMLEAYGFTRQGGRSGRPENDCQELIDYLMEKYSDGPKPKNMGILIYENPELRGKLKTLQNKSNELFGMPLAEFFSQIGILPERGAAAQAAKNQAGPSKEAAAMEALRALYETKYASRGSFSEAAALLEGLTLKQNKSGQFYLFGVKRCPTHVSLPFGVQLISANCFRGSRELCALILPDSVEEIGAGAFADCASLEKAELGQSLSVIGPEAFAGCTALREITIPASVARLGNGAFAGCTALEKVMIGNPALSVPPDAFEGCIFRYEPYSDTDCTAPEDFLTEPAKKGTVAITGYIGAETDIRIPSIINGAAVSTVGVGAFMDHQQLRSVIVPDSVTSIQKDAFRDCRNLRKVHLSNAVDKLITTTFSGCTSLEEINLPDALTELKRNCFRDSSIRRLFIGKGLRAIPPDAFVKNVTDPYSGEWRIIRTIESITVSHENPWLSAEGSCLYSGDGKKLLGAFCDIRQFEIPERVEEIEDGAFAQMKTLTDIRFPAGLRRIGSGAFCRTGLRSIRLGAALRIIEDCAFEYCDALSSVIFDNGVESIGDEAFEGCPIVSVYLPASLKSLGVRSFSCFGSYNDRISDLRIDPQNPYLRADGNALYQIENGRKTLTVLYDQKYKQIEYDIFKKAPQYAYDVENGTVCIAEDAFVNCVNLTSVTLPDGLEEIGSHAFRNTGVTSFVLPASLRSIGAGAFAAERTWEGDRFGARQIEVSPGNSALYTQNGVLFIRKPDGSAAAVTYFGEESSVTLPPDTTELYPEAFVNSDVEQVNLPVGVSAIGEKAFVGCGALRRLRFGVTTPSGARKSAVVYFPAVDNNGDYWGNTIRDQLMDCIRTGIDGDILDFEKYGSLFESIVMIQDKILVAIDRLKSPLGLASVYGTNYRRFLTERKEQSVIVCIRFDDTEGLNLLAELGCITFDKIDKYIETANLAEKTDCQVFLLNYKNEQFGFASPDFSLDLDLDLDFNIDIDSTKL